MNALGKKVLVLNSMWQAVSLTTGRDAVCKVFSGKAQVVGQDFGIHDFDSWIGLGVDNGVPSDRAVPCVRFLFFVPEIILLPKTKDCKRRRMRFSRKMVFDRDNYTCQYCCESFHPKDLTLDHVVPKSQGGIRVWLNIVTACSDCNAKKDDRTPGQAGMRLLKQPKKPQWYVPALARMNEIPESWGNWLK